MTQSIVLKTDASYKKGVGCAISYNLKVEGDDGVEQYKDSKFTRSVANSTHGELVAAVYGILETIEILKDVKNYKVRIGVDCEFVVKSLNEKYPEQPTIVKTALNMLNLFKDWMITWIPRAKNSEADALARSERMKHEEDI